MKKQSLRLSMFGIAALMMSACTNEAFDNREEEAFNNDYAVHWLRTFGPIDPNQTWNMATPLKAQIDNESFGAGSTVIIYNDAPECGGRIIGMAHESCALTLDVVRDTREVYALATGENASEVKGYFKVVDGTVRISASEADTSSRMSRGMHTPDKFNWMIACEDMGSTGDYDFNDVVLGVNYIAGTGKLYLTPMAAGGTLETYVCFDGERVSPEVHSWLSGNEGASIKGMLNTTTFNGMGKKVCVDVGKTWSLSEGLDKITVEVVGKGGSSYVSKPEKGTAPQMICLAGDWYWPQEKFDLKTVYEGFTTWNGDASAVDWMNTHTPQIVEWTYQPSCIYATTTDNKPYRISINGTYYSADSGGYWSAGSTAYQPNPNEWFIMPCDVFQFWVYLGWWSSNVETLDMSRFDASMITIFDLAFARKSQENTTSLISIDFSNFDTSSATSMKDMFWDQYKLTELDLSSFDTSKVTNMYDMFEGCSGLTSLDLSNFVTSEVKNMSSMFSGCSGLTSLDLSKFDTAKVTNMGYMFYNCPSTLEITCKAEFRQWCIDNAATIGLPEPLKDATSPQWHIVAD